MRRNHKIKKSLAPLKLVPSEIVGLTTKNANGLASSLSSSSFAYIAGCVAVVYDVDLGNQSLLLVSHRMPKPLSCVAMSPDGRFVAAGESGQQPAVLVWDRSTLALISELKGHIYGVSCVAFSPDGEHLLSVGKYTHIWEWQNGRLITKLKASAPCFEDTTAIFSSDKKSIITAGKKHLRFWTVGISPRTRLHKGLLTVAMQGKPINLCPQKGSSFISVTSASWTEQGSELCATCATYAITDAGVLCLIDSGFLRKSIDLKVQKGFAVSASTKLVACACSNGIVHLLKTGVLEYLGKLLYSKAKNIHEGPVSQSPQKENIQNFPHLPDAVACQFTAAEKLVVVYGDHSLYIWDIHDVNKASRCCVLVSHSACIWDVKNLICDNMHDTTLVCAARGCSGGVSFATCSADGTIRLWDLVQQTEISEDSLEQNSSMNQSMASVRLVGAGIFSRDIVEPTFSNLEFRSMAVSADGKYMSAGDCEGNLHIYDLQNTNYTCIKDAHEAEILSLSFNMSSKVGIDSTKSTNSHYILASGGRDGKVHLYDVKRNFDLIGHIDDHSAAVTSIKLSCDGCKVLSCSADRLLMFRDINITASGCEIRNHKHHVVSQGTVYDMAIDPLMEAVITVDQGFLLPKTSSNLMIGIDFFIGTKDKKISMFDIASGQHIRSFNQYKDFGDPIKVTVDPSCSYLVCSYSNKSLCIYDFASGEMIAQAIGHGEVVTGVIFLPDCKHIVSVGGDGCMFLWKLPAHLTSKMLSRAKENPVALSSGILSREEGHICGTHIRYALSSESLEDEQCLKKDSRQASAFKLTISRLPKWAKNKVETSDFAHLNSELVSLQNEEEQEIFSPTIGNFGSSNSANCEDQSPSAHDHTGNLSRSSLCGSSPQTSKSLSSASQEKGLSFSSFAKENQWLTIYTVMPSLLSSPEMLNRQDVAVATKLPTDVDELPGECEHSFANDSTLMAKHVCLCNNDFLRKDKFQIEQQKKANCERIPDDPGKTCLNETELQDPMDINTFQRNSEDSDLFNDHYGSLSTSLKIDKRKACSSRRYTGQYFLQQDQQWGYSKLFCTPVKIEGSVKHGKESENNVLLENSSPSVSKEQGRTGQETTSKSQPMERKDEKQCGCGETQTEERIAACRKALLDLEAAAHSVSQLFTELGEKCPVGDKDPYHETGLAQLYDQAAALLPQIAEKVVSIAHSTPCKLIGERKE